MSAEEIGAQLAMELKGRYLYRCGRWLLRQPDGWRYTATPRLMIWQAMVARKRAGVVPSVTLANDIQRSLESIFNGRYASTN